MMHGTMNIEFQKIVLDPLVSGIITMCNVQKYFRKIDFSLPPPRVKGKEGTHRIGVVDNAIVSMSTIPVNLSTFV
jgi:hypothetical protein